MHRHSAQSECGTTNGRLPRDQSMPSIENVSHSVRSRKHRQRRRQEVRRLSEGDMLPRYDHPIHDTQDSLFSSTSGFGNYRGFLNLCIILLVLSNTRVAVENILKYGILVDPFMWITIFLAEPYHWPNVMLTLFGSIFVWICFETELLMAKGTISHGFGFLVNVLNIGTLLCLPVGVILTLKPNAFASCISCMMYSILFLKLVSYVQVNNWCRRSVGTDVSRRLLATYPNFEAYSKSTKSTLVSYPFNLTGSDMCYFIFAPTLCYELNFPRTSRVRKWFVAKRALEFTFLAPLIFALSQQWIVPLLKNAVEPLIDMELWRVIERLLKLAIPNHILWLMGFYMMFHSWLNFTAELLRFGDREFYKDWWNAESIEYFWRNWNIPVHRWCVRHVFFPLIEAGMSKRRRSLLLNLRDKITRIAANFHFAAVAVFLVSAFFHEYLVSVPLCIFRLYAFGGMLAQIPLQQIIGENRLFRGKFANMAVWCSLIVGQPLAILMYLHDYYVKNYVEQDI